MTTTIGWIMRNKLGNQSVTLPDGRVWTLHPYLPLGWASLRRRTRRAGQGLGSAAAGSAGLVAISGDIAMAAMLFPPLVLVALVSATAGILGLTALALVGTLGAVAFLAALAVMLLTLVVGLRHSGVTVIDDRGTPVHHERTRSLVSLLARRRQLARSLSATGHLPQTALPAAMPDVDLDAEFTLKPAASWIWRATRRVVQFVLVAVGVHAGVLAGLVVVRLVRSQGLGLDMMDADVQLAAVIAWVTIMCYWMAEIIDRP